MRLRWSVGAFALRLFGASRDLSPARSPEIVDRLIAFNGTCGIEASYKTTNLRRGLLSGFAIATFHVYFIHDLLHVRNAGRELFCLLAQHGVINLALERQDAVRGAVLNMLIVEAVGNQHSLKLFFDGGVNILVDIPGLFLDAFRTDAYFVGDDVTAARFLGDLFHAIFILLALHVAS